MDKCKCGEYKEEEKEICENCEEEIFDEAYERYQEKLISDFYHLRC